MARMKNILLLHPRLLFYKIRIYNQLSLELERIGYKLYIWYPEIQKANEPVNFEAIEIKMSARNFIKVVSEKKIDFVMNILSKRRPFLGIYLFSLFYSKLINIKTIYYGHGLDVSSRNKKWKVYLQNIIHLLFDRILLYGENEKKYLWKINKNKAFVAGNTLLLRGYEILTNTGKGELRGKYNIKEEKVVLFCGRIEQRKRIDILIDIFVQKYRNQLDVCLVIVGPGLSEKHQSIAKQITNIYYLGPVYDEAVINELFYLSDVFCVPGSLGLGLVEAMYWGNPILTMNVLHGPEICYLKDGFNGYIVNDKVQIIHKLDLLIGNDSLRNKLSINARETIIKEATLERMFKGFYDVLESLN
jgi:glycosyltransferase involved in cell wall biosynthesis